MGILIILAVFLIICILTLELLFKVIRMCFGVKVAKIFL